MDKYAIPSLCSHRSPVEGMPGLTLHQHLYGAHDARPNNSNILCLGGRITGVFEALDIPDVWLTTSYEGGRHDMSLEPISQAERARARAECWSPGDPTKT